MIKWNKSLSVGNEKFDDQHKRLLDLIEDFYNNLQNRTNEQKLAILIKEMREYTIYHFKDEEEDLKKVNYPKLQEQIVAHNGFVKKVEELEHRFSIGKLKLTMEVTSFLKRWVVEHIQGADKEYSEYFLNKD